ncbi:MAG: hypothetical protein ABSD62_13840 [Candidatus Limnocylindrales bacterium]|jgi:hypothetical protein
MVDIAPVELNALVAGSYRSAVDTLPPVRWSVPPPAIRTLPLRSKVALSPERSTDTGGMNGARLNLPALGS